MSNKPITKPRDYHGDLIRLVAMLLVIGCHTPLSHDMHPFLYSFISLLQLCCNGLFLLLSGRFNLRFEPDENDVKGSYLGFYYKKFLSVVVPLLFYATGIFVVTNWGNYGPSNVLDFFRDFYERIYVTNTTTPMWFFYALIGLLLAAPFLSIMLHRLTQIEMKIFMVIMTGLEFFVVFVFYNLLGDNCPVNWIFTGWVIYFIAGFMIHEIEEFHSKRWLFVIVGFVCLALSAFTLTYFPEYAVRVNDDSPFFLFACIGLYLLLEAVPIPEKVGKAMSFVAKYAFGVLLLHYDVLVWIKVNHPDWYATGFGYVAVILGVAVFCFAIAFVVDNVIINPFCRFMKTKVKGSRIALALIIIFFAVLPIGVMTLDEVKQLDLSIDYGAYEDGWVTNDAVYNIRSFHHEPNVLTFTYYKDEKDPANAGDEIQFFVDDELVRTITVSDIEEGQFAVELDLSFLQRHKLEIKSNFVYDPQDGDERPLSVHLDGKTPGVF
ncbi:MAG: acyltransferase [Pseudobutyrivibrio sp.]|nr:acyltransferase [Pseudobutyrivibrio sp.]